jgi:protein phosphatase
MPDQHDDGASRPIGGDAAGAPLAPGDRVGDYVVERALDDAAPERAYLARLADGAEAGPEAGPERAFRLIERPRGGHDDLRLLLRLHLDHPHLLAPRTILSRDDRDYLVIESADPADGDAPRLAPGDALTAGLALADALAYLHGRGVAHLHVGPLAVVVADGGVRLAGVERAELVHPQDPQAPPLFARDANFLARTLGVLAEVESEDDSPTADPRTAALAAIVRRGTDNAFTTAEEVREACSAALLQPGRRLPEAPALPPGASLVYAIGCATSVGLVRAENQDAAATAVFDVRDDPGVDPRGVADGLTSVAVFLVADGMGGEARGELASRIAARVALVEMVRELLPALHAPAEHVLEPAPMGDALPRLAGVALRAGRAANARVWRLGQSLGRQTGTTLTALVAAGAQAALVHVGDSRAYLLRAGALTQLTEDHTLLARLQAVNHPLLRDPDVAIPRNYLYRCLGQDEETALDATELTLAPGDRLLLCSDGLWDELASDLLRDHLAHGDGPQACAEALVAAADDAGGHDNSTAVVVFVQGSEPAPAGSAGGSAADAAPRNTSPGAPPADAGPGAR